MIIQGVCNSYKKEILEGVHLIDHSYKIALFSPEAILNPQTTSYLNLQYELEDGDGYDRGGVILEDKEIKLNNEVASFTFKTNPVWYGAVFVVSGALIYNDSLPKKNSVAVIDFNSNIVVNNENFEVILSGENSNESLIQII